MEFKLKYPGCYVDSDKLFALPVGTWREQRPVIELSKCCQCGWCYLFCPTGCIVEKRSYFEIDLNYCKGCSICASVCPVNAIKMLREA